MLQLKYLFENFGLAKTALQNWEHDTDTLDEMLAKFRISSNAIYPFYSGGKVCFLRLAPVEEKLERNIAGEMEFIDFLVRQGFPALVPVKTKTGDMFLKINTEWGEYYAAAFSKVGGVSIENTDYSDEIVTEYAKTLGRLHALSAEYSPEHRKWSHIDALDWIKATLREYGADGEIIAALTALRTELDALPVSKENYGLIHYDFEPDNVFYDKDSRKCAVIDFDDGMYHWYAMDVEQVFVSLEGELSGDALEKAKKQFLAGYKTEYTYTEETEASRPLMRRFIDLYSYTRLIRCVAETLPNEPEWMAGLRKKLDTIIADTKRDILIKGRGFF